MPSIDVELKRTLDEMGGAWESMKRTMERIDQGTASKEELEKVNAAITELRKEQNELNAQLQRSRLLQTTISSDDPEEQLQLRAYEKFLRYGKGENSTTRFTPEELAALGSAHVRTLSDVNDGTGGYLAPAAFESQIIMAAHERAAIRPIANVNTTGSNLVETPKLAKPIFAWGHQGVAIPPSMLSDGMDVLPINELTGLYLLANTTLEDEQANVLGELTAGFGRGIAEEEDKAFSIGDAVKKPQGLLMHAGVLARYVPTGVAAALSDGSNPLYDTLVDALHTLTTYRPNSTWAMNSTVEGECRKMKDNQGMPIWQMPVSANTPASLLGRPIINPENMPNVAANSHPIIVGDFSHYRIRDRRGLTVQRLSERYAEYRQTGFLVTKRVGGQCVLAEAFTPIRVAVS